MPTCCVYGCRPGYKYSQTRGNISDGNTRQQRIRRIHRDNFPPNDAVTACALFIFVKLTLLRPLAKTPTSDENADLSNYSDDIWKPPPCPLCLKLCKAIFPLNRRTKDIFQIVRCGFPWTDCECHEVYFVLSGQLQCSIFLISSTINWHVGLSWISRLQV